MLSLAFSEKSLEVQRQVVIEEFKQRYLNQPYGDIWLKLRPLAYTTHPYRWATIGIVVDRDLRTRRDGDVRWSKFIETLRQWLSDLEAALGARRHADAVTILQHAVPEYRAGENAAACEPLPQK